MVLGVKGVSGGVGDGDGDRDVEDEKEDPDVSVCDSPSYTAAGSEQIKSDTRTPTILIRGF